MDVRSDALNVTGDVLDAAMTLAPKQDSDQDALGRSHPAAMTENGRQDLAGHGRSHDSPQSLRAVLVRLLPADPEPP